MKNKVSIIIILLAIPLFCNGQSLDDYLHTGSNLYINGQMKEAKAKILEGIQKFPNDPKLKALAEKIKEEDKKEQEKKDQEKKEQDKKEQDKQNKDDQNKQDQQNKDQQKQQDQQNKDQQGKDGQDKKQQEQAGQISTGDAERILDALKNDEKAVQLRLQQQKAKEDKQKEVKRRGNPSKNW